MSVPESCPNCQASFQGEPIPEMFRSFYGNHTHYSRILSMTNLATDRVENWQCPDCNYKWERIQS